MERRVGGPVGQRLAENVRALRESRNLNQPQLARLVTDLGVVLHATGVSKIELADRRVDVDDLVALAIALGVSPNRLLLTGDITVPGDDGRPTEVRVELTPSLTVRAGDAWRWAAGEKPLSSPPPDRELDPRVEAEIERAFLRENRPDAGDYVLDYGIVVGDRQYVVHSILSNLMAALDRGLNADALHQLVDTAVKVRNGGTAADVAQPVVAAIVTSAKGVLIGRRNDRTPPWTFIAGEVEPGEQPEDAAVREVKEETGCEVRTGEEIGRRVHPKTGRAMIYMAAHPERSTRLIVGDEAELAEVKWASLAEAEELMPDMFGPVRDYLARTLSGGAR